MKEVNLHYILNNEVYKGQVLILIESVITLLWVRVKRCDLNLSTLKVGYWDKHKFSKEIIIIKILK